MVDAGRPWRVRKSPGVTLADLGDVECFGRDGIEDQLYAFQLADGVYKRKDGVISSDGSTFMQGNLDLGGKRIVSLTDPAEPQEVATKGYVDSQILDSRIRLQVQLRDSICQLTTGNRKNQYG